MKKTRLTISTEPNCYCKFKRSLPGLFWAELVLLIKEYRDFEHGGKGTRFDRWLPKKKLTV